MPNFTLLYLAEPGSSDTGAGDAVYVANGWDETVFQFVMESTDASAFTWNIQGSVDGTDGDNWYDLLYVTEDSNTPSDAAISRTTTGADIIFGVRPYQWFRLVTSGSGDYEYRCELRLV